MKNILPLFLLTTFTLWSMSTKGASGSIAITPSAVNTRCSTICPAQTAAPNINATEMARGGQVDSTQALASDSPPVPPVDSPVILKKDKKNHTKKNRPKKKRQRQRRRCQTSSNPRYRKMLSRLRKVPNISKPKYRDGYRELILYSVNHGERIRIFPFLADGSIDPAAKEKIEYLFRDKTTEAIHPIHPRLIKLLQRLSDHFKARQITIFSGYRESTSNTESNHTKGRAADILIPGISQGKLAYKARLLGHVGVGLYPNSGFVHIDIRDGPSFFWKDRSGPGKPSCLRRILTKTAAKSDRKWRAKHDEPRQHRNRKGKLLGETPKPPQIAAETTVQIDVKTESDRGL